MAGVPVIARLAISTTLFGGTLILTRALPPELLTLVPDFISGPRRSGA
jgi:hypothetical protein